MAREIEIKFRVDDLRALTRKLRAAGFHLKTKRTHEMNTLYDLPGEVLRGRKELLRLRKYGSEWKLTHKSAGKKGRHSSRIELETGVSDGKTNGCDSARAWVLAIIPLREIPRGVGRRQGPGGGRRNSDRKLLRDRRAIALDRRNREETRHSSPRVHHEELCDTFRRLEARDRAIAPKR